MSGAADHLRLLFDRVIRHHVQRAEAGDRQWGRRGLRGCAACGTPGLKRVDEMRQLARGNEPGCQLQDQVIVVGSLDELTGTVEKGVDVVDGEVVELDEGGRGVDAEAAGDRDDVVGGEPVS